MGILKELIIEGLSIKEPSPDEIKTKADQIFTNEIKKQIEDQCMQKIHNILQGG